MNLRRITVVQAPAGAMRALDALAEIAVALEAELLGLFVEDMELLYFARLPFAREISVSSAMSRALDPEAMERALRSKAEQARRALAAAAAGTPMRWSFRVARGFVADQVLAAVADADLVVLFADGSEAGRPRLAAVLPSAAQRSIVAPALVRLARALGGDMDLVLLGAKVDAARAWQEATHAVLAEEAPPGGMRIRSVAREEDLFRTLRELGYPVSRPRAGQSRAALPARPTAAGTAGAGNSAHSGRTARSDSITTR